MSDTHKVMLVVPDPVTMDGTVLHGEVGDIVSDVHWAEARAAEDAGLVVVVDEIEDELSQILRAATA